VKTLDGDCQDRDIGDMVSTGRACRSLKPLDKITRRKFILDYNTCTQMYSRVRIHASPSLK